MEEGGTFQNLMGGGGGGGLSQYILEHGVGLKMLLKNTCEGVHLIVKLATISLQIY